LVSRGVSQRRSVSADPPPRSLFLVMLQQVGGPPVGPVLAPVHPHDAPQWLVRPAPAPGGGGQGIGPTHQAEAEWPIMSIIFISVLFFLSLNKINFAFLCDLGRCQITVPSWSPPKILRMTRHPPAQLGGGSRNPIAPGLAGRRETVPDHPVGQDDPSATAAGVPFLHPPSPTFRWWRMPMPTAVHFNLKEHT